MAHVSKITDTGVVRLVGACTRLRSVDVNFCSNLGDLAVLELATLPSLRRLSLVQLRKLTDNAVFFLAEHTPTLERLHLSHCDGLSLDSIHHAIRKLPELAHLSATGIPALARPGDSPSGHHRTVHPETRSRLGFSPTRKLGCFAHSWTKRWSGNGKQKPVISSLCHARTMQRIYTDGLGDQTGVWMSYCG